MAVSIPAGMAAGIYDILILNPDGNAGTLAFYRKPNLQITTLPATSTWNNSGISTGSSRIYAGVAQLYNSFYILGGYDGSSVLNGVEINP